MATVVKDFRYTGAAQAFVIPANVTSVFWELWGAPGGQGVGDYASPSGQSGATGAGAFNNGYSRTNVQLTSNTKTLVGYVSGTTTVTPGDSYSLYVGGAGGYGNNADGAASSTTNYGPAGWNGGANGGYSVPGVTGNGRYDTVGAQYPGGGGGGASDIRHGGTALGNRIAVAGGGGGAGGYFAISQATATNNPTTPTPPYSNDLVPGNGDNGGPNTYPTAGPRYGGPGGGVTGGTGGGASRGSNDNISNAGGLGGSQTAGGAGGTSTGTFSNAGAAGASGVGGHGGNVLLSDYTGSSNAAVAGGGGGGGGYFGGGGGASGTKTVAGFVSAGGGGGGSNYVGGLTGPVSLAHVPPAGVDGQTGVNGFARATYVQPPNAPTLLSPVNGSYVDVNTPLVLAWSFSSLVTSETQGGFDIGYSVSGVGSWTTLPNPGITAQTGSIPASSLTAGTNYDIRVRVYDSHGDVSAYTTITVHAVAVPNAPTITSPANGSTLSTDPFNVTWTVDGGVTETLYRVTAEDASGHVIVDSGDLYSTRVNACTNPSFETSTAGWTTMGGASLAQSTAHSVVPTHSGKITWATGAAQTQGALFQFPTIPGKSYTVSAYVTVDTVGTDPDLLVAALDADGVSQLGSPATVHPTTAGTFVRGSTTFVAQNTTSYLAILNAVAATAAQVGYVDAVLIEYGVNLNGYFDGSNANGNPGTASWQGTTNLSASQLAIANVLTYSVNWPLPSQPIVVKVRYADTADQNLYSAPGVSAPIVNLNPPSAPVVSLAIDNDAGTVALTITNPAGTFSAIYNEVWRKDLTNGTPEVKLTTLAPNVNFTDYTPVTQTVYAYRVRAYSSIGGFADAT